MNVTIRPYQPGDETGMAVAHKASIMQLCSADYPPELCEQWSGNPSSDTYVRHITERGYHYWVATEEHTIAGFGSWNDDEISRFYIHPDYAGQGVGTRLFNAMEKDYQAHSGKNYMHIESTITAKPFYEKMGFSNLGPKVVTLRNGTQVPCFTMRKEYAHA